LTPPQAENIPSDLEGLIEDDLSCRDYLNSFDEVRLDNVQGRLDLNKIEDLDLNILLFQMWLTHDEYVVVRRSENLNGLVKRKLISIKASKKGNDIYSYKLEKKMGVVMVNLERVIISDEKFVNALYVTLTYDPKVEPDRNKAWLNFGKEFNKFLSHLKKIYGNVIFVRSWEASRSAYPHSHGTLVFLDHKFEWFEHTSTKGKRKGMITKRILKEDKDKIASMWHSNVDVLAVGGSRYEIKRAIKDVLFYVTKNQRPNKGMVQENGRGLGFPPPEASEEKPGTCRDCLSWPCGVWEDWNADHSKVIKNTPTTELDDKACSDFKDKRKIRMIRTHHDGEDSNRMVTIHYEAIQDQPEGQDDQTDQEEDPDGLDYKQCHRWPKKRLLTCSIIWYLGLRSYAVSRSLLSDQEDIEGVEADLRTARGVIQTAQSDLDGNLAVVEYKFVGMIAGDRIGMKGEWIKIYDEEPEWVREVFVPKKIRRSGGVCSLGEAFR